MNKANKLSAWALFPVTGIPSEFQIKFVKVTCNFLCFHLLQNILWLYCYFFQLYCLFFILCDGRPLLHVLGMLLQDHVDKLSYAIISWKYWCTRLKKRSPVAVQPSNCNRQFQFNPEWKLNQCEHSWYCSMKKLHEYVEI